MVAIRIVAIVRIVAIIRIVAIVRIVTIVRIVAIIRIVAIVRIVTIIRIVAIVRIVVIIRIVAIILIVTSIRIVVAISIVESIRIVVGIRFFCVLLNLVSRGRRGRDRIVVAISAYHHLVRTPAHDEVYSIQHYVIKFVSHLRQVGGFPRGLLFPPPIKLTAMI